MTGHRYRESRGVTLKSIASTAPADCAPQGGRRDPAIAFTVPVPRRPRNDDCVERANGTTRVSSVHADALAMWPLSIAIRTSITGLSTLAGIPEFMYGPIVETSEEPGIFGHGFTYSGHPVCSAVALRTLELLEERGIYAHVQAMTAPFQQRLNALRQHPLVGDIRGVGLIGGLELAPDKATKALFEPERGMGLECAARCEARGPLVRPLADTLALCPPLIITDIQIDELFCKLEAALDETLTLLGRNR